MKTLLKFQKKHIQSKQKIHKTFLILFFLGYCPTLRFYSKSVTMSEVFDVKFQKIFGKWFVAI